MTKQTDTVKKRAASSRARKPRPGAAPTNSRDSALSITRLKNIVGAIQLGNFVETACEYAGIGRSTFYEWKRRGAIELDRVHSLPRTNLEKIMESFEGEDPNDVDDNTGRPKDKGTAEYMWSHRPRQFDAVEWPYAVFNHLTDRARAQAEVRHIGNIMKAAQAGQWQASGWWLERTMPKKYGRPDTKVQVSGTKGGEPIRSETVVTVNQLNEALAKLMGIDPEEQP